MESTILVRHVTAEVRTGFGLFTQNLETLLGRFDPSLYEHFESDPAGSQKRLEEATGEQGLLLFSVQAHAKLLNLVGAPRKARQYTLGNPLIAMTMTQHDIRAGLYAPLRMLVYEADDRSVKVEYDLPSTL